MFETAVERFGARLIWKYGGLEEALAATIETNRI
jgi:hypothetical protein